MYCSIKTAVTGVVSIGEEGKDDVQMNSHIPGAER